MKTILVSKFGTCPRHKISYGRTTDVFDIYAAIARTCVLQNVSLADWITNLNFTNSVTNLLNHLFASQTNRGRITKMGLTLDTVIDTCACNAEVAALIIHTLFKADLITEPAFYESYVLERGPARAELQSGAPLSTEQVANLLTWVDFYEKVFCPEILQLEKKSYDVCDSSRVAYFYASTVIPSIQSLCYAFESTLQLRVLRDGIGGVRFDQDIFLRALRQCAALRFGVVPDEMAQYADLVTSEIDNVLSYSNVVGALQPAELAQYLTVNPLLGAIRRCASALQVHEKMQIFDTQDVYDRLADEHTIRVLSTPSGNIVTTLSTDLARSREKVIDIVPHPLGFKLVASNETTNAVFGIAQAERKEIVDLVSRLDQRRLSLVEVYPSNVSDIAVQVCAGLATVDESIKRAICYEIGKMYLGEAAATTYTYSVPYSVPVANIVGKLDAQRISGQAITDNLDTATFIALLAKGGTNSNSEDRYICGAPDGNIVLSRELTELLQGQADTFRVVDTRNFLVNAAAPGIEKPIAFHIPNILAPSGYYGTKVSVYNDSRVTALTENLNAYLTAVAAQEDLWVSTDSEYIEYMLAFISRSLKYYGDIVKQMVQSVTEDAQPDDPAVLRLQRRRTVVAGSLETLTQYIAVVDPALGALIARIRTFAFAAAERLHIDLLQESV